MRFYDLQGMKWVFAFFIVMMIIAQAIAAIGGVLMLWAFGSFSPWIGYAIGAAIIVIVYSLMEFIRELP